MDWANHGYLIAITVRSFSVPPGYKFECGIYELSPLLSWHSDLIYSLERFASTSMSLAHTGLTAQLTLFLNNAVSYYTSRPVGLIFAFLLKSSFQIKDL